MNAYLLDIHSLLDTPDLALRSFFVSSTAPVNIEQAPTAANAGDPQVAIDEIARFIADHSGTADYPHGVEVVVLIHGYNTDFDYVEGWYRRTCEQMARQYPPSDRARVFLCYRWPSEPMAKVFRHSIKAAQIALPRSLRWITQSSKLGIITALIGLVFGLLLVVSEGVRFLALFLVFTMLLIIAIAISIPILTLLGLRVSNYFRDTYRASHYGVADLVELIRQLDAALMQQSGQQWSKPRIRLSFIGHSLGAFVVTQTVRTLSDVFDRQSIATLDLNQRTAPPSGNVGNVYQLGRLVLVAPDISAENIISGRGNTLRSAIRRFEEAYVFSNEADLALRLASTIANYFSFPTSTRDGGYRLGNVVVRERGQGGERVQRYGILNQQADGKLSDRRDFLEHLLIRPDCSLQQRQGNLWGNEVERQSSNQSPKQSPDQSSNQCPTNTYQRKSIAELFTYFDFSNYVESAVNAASTPSSNRGVLGLADGKNSLGIWDYLRLLLAMGKGKTDPHGGYIFAEQAQFCQQLIYGLGCLGMADLLATMAHHPDYAVYRDRVHQAQPQLQPQQQERLAQLQCFSALCASHQLQVLLSPERYNVDVLQGQANRVGY
jgi:pimeloyl-ACP methyl ester carboxylesterase